MHPTLRDHLRCYLDSHPSTSIPALAKKGGVSEMTVRRIVQGETQAGFETAAALLCVTATREQLVAILLTEFPMMAKAIEHVWPKEGYSIVNDAAINNVLSSGIGCYITNLAACRVGVSREKVRELYGKAGIKIVDSMIENGTFVETNGVIHFRDKDFSSPNIEVSIAQIKHLADVYEQTNPGHGLTIQTESVNEEGVRAAQRALIECAEKIAQIRQEPKYAGSIPLYFCAMLNRIFSDK